ncbi:MAG: PKD domain-containing protein [Janthinobacterium lividum]
MPNFFRSVLRRGAAAAALLGLAHATLAQTLPARPASYGPQPASSLLHGRPAAEASRQAAIAAQPTRRNSRIGGHLQRLYNQAGGAGGRLGAVGAQTLRSDFPDLKFDKAASSVVVRITAEDVNALLPSLVSRGFQVIAARPDLHLVEGLLPLSQLVPGSAGIEGLASRGLLGVLPSLRPRMRGGLVTSQADYTLEAARTRATRPRSLTGAGVRIGVMSDSYNALNGAAADVASGDLPAAGVQVLQDVDQEYQFGTDEGRAMCQLIYDLAPGAPLAFSSVDFGELDFAQQILNLADPSKGNCSVLVDDIGYLGEPFYQDGVIAQAINQVVASRNVTYYAAAGNYGSQSYENNAPQFGLATIGTKAAYRLNFDVSGASTDATQTITLPDGKGFEPVLEWSDPFYTRNGVKTDLDMYLIAVKNGVASDTVARSDDNNVQSQVPVEYLSYTNSSATSGTTTFNLVIVRRNGTANPARLKYVDSSDYGLGPTEWQTYSSTLLGHPTAVGAQAVAAAGYYNQRVAETYSALGGAIPILFNANGTALGSVQTRQKPDITSIDGADTSFFPQYSGADFDLNGYPNFFGTSAAAPHAAAVAALLRQSEPSLTPAQVYSRLASTARLLGTTTTDPYTGPGLIDAYAAVYGPVVASGPAVQDFEKGALPMSWTVSSTVSGRVRVVSTLGPASGNYHLLLDAPFTVSNARSLNEVTWYLTGLGSNAQLTFRERKQAGETDELMPAQFTGRSNSDGVALSVDGGTTWYRVYDLTGTNATTTYQTKTVNLTQFASANGLTLGADVRLKFQQYSGTGITSVALANQRGRLFDDIAVTGASAAPIPLYTAGPPATGCPGLQVQFADTSALRPTAWSWTFPGGTPSTSTARNPLVTYNTPGHFGVTLSVSNAGGTATRADTGVVYIYGRAPLAVLSASAASVCPGSQVTFTSTASYCPGTFAWSFPGGSPSTSAVQNPSPVTYATAGTYLATLTVSNGYGSTTVTQSIEVTKGRSLPFSENFNASLSLPAGWTVVNPDGKFAWAVRDTTIGRDGTRSRVLRAPFSFDPNTGERDAVYTPALDLTGVSGPSLQFDLAYTTATSGGITYSDSLIVQVADACSGAVLGRAYAKGGATLATAATRATLFVPRSGADWRRETVNLSAYAGRSVVLRFVGYNDYGNSLYLDNVLVSGTVLATTSAAAAMGLETWPVPAPAGSALNVRLPAYSGTVELRLLDALGRVVWHEQLSQSGAALERTLPLPTATGAYTLLYQPATGTSAARKLLVE